MMHFSVVARFSGYIRYNGESDISDVERLCRENLPDHVIDVGEQGESEYAYLADEFGDPLWRDDAYDVSVSAMLTKPEFEAWRDALYLTAKDENTLGTLGGPMGPFCVPDIVFGLDENAVIDTVRVTPIPCNLAGDPIPRNERFERFSEDERRDYAGRLWDRLRAATLKTYGEDR